MAPPLDDRLDYANRSRKCGAAACALCLGQHCGGCWAHRSYWVGQLHLVNTSRNSWQDHDLARRYETRRAADQINYVNLDGFVHGLRAELDPDSAQHVHGHLQGIRATLN